MADVPGPTRAWSDYSDGLSRNRRFKQLQIQCLLFARLNCRANLARLLRFKGRLLNIRDGCDLVLCINAHLRQKRDDDFLAGSLWLLPACRLLQPLGRQEAKEKGLACLGASTPRLIPSAVKAQYHSHGHLY